MRPALPAFAEEPGSFPPDRALDLLGPAAEVESAWTDGYLFSISGPIYAGTNEIQRNIVAERILGLPKEVRG